MAVRPIRIVGDPVLHTPTRLVTEFGEELHTLAADMFDTMAAAQGVGLAANQIGAELRLFVYDCPDGRDARHRGVVVNPVLET
ncbi:MAG: peptide deformylase, partial [Candidatus Dormibacteria bacterium]